jgi:hypothetical protein
VSTWKRPSPTSIRTLAGRQLTAAPGETLDVRKRTMVAAIAAALLVCLSLSSCRPGHTGATPTEAAAAPTATGSGSTPDALASALDQINSLINDINDSLSGADATDSDGE